MKYLCLIYLQEAELEAVPGDEIKRVYDECVAHTETLKAEGRFLASERLESVRTATTLRATDNGVTVTDGPFAETKEQLAGFYLIEAENLDEAIDIARGIPPGRFGAIELRPVREA